MASKKAKEDIITFFDNIEGRRFTDASRILQKIKKKKFGDTELKDGYIKALEGILISSRTGDERDFLNRAPFDGKNLKRYKKEFGELIKNGVHSSFDIGYFLAWSDLVQYRLNVNK
jgi:hypothetical protein